MDLSEERFSSLLDAIYDCALDPTKWTEVLAIIGRELRAKNGQILSRSDDALEFACAWGSSDEDRRIYMEQYASVDPMNTLVWHAPVGEPVTMDRFISRQEMQQTKVYREYLKPRGWDDFVLIVLEKNAARVSLVGFTRNQADGPFGAGDLDLMRRLAPHVRRAVMLGGVLSTTAARAADLDEAFGRMAVPAVLIDSAGYWLQANDAATAMFGLTESGARSPPHGSAMAAAFAKSFAANLRTIGDSPMPAASLPFRDAQGRAHIAHVVPLDRQGRPGGRAPGRAAAVVFVQEVGKLAPLPGEVLVKLYGLTPAETRLAALLAQGHGLDTAGDALGIAVTTVRTHLQRLFDKTGTRRQADLVRLDRKSVV